MPELPEVETVRRQLEPRMVGRRLVSVTIDDVRLTRPEAPQAVASLLTGRDVGVVARRGKYLLFELDGDLSWIVHLRMTGSFSLTEAAPGSHVRATLVLDDGAHVHYRDVRRFGTWAVLDHGAREAFFADRLGPEPLEASFDPTWLAQRLSRSRAPVKAALLDQRTVAGVGNIYADEAFWRAGVHPGRPAASLATRETARLVSAVKDAINLGIERQGATLRDYRSPNGAPGAMQEEFAVYGREGEPCERCSAPIAKTRLAGRGTWFCPDCQVLGSD